MSEESPKWTRRGWLAHCSVAAGLAAGTPGAIAAAAAVGRRLLVLGDSLSAEYGLARGTGWVALLEDRLAASKIEAQVINASVSGETTAGGRSRLPPLLTQHRPTHLVIELGANDALRGLPLSMTRENLSAMARAAQAAGAKAMLIGMRLPPNYGARYGEAFAALYANVAQSEGAALVPFMLRGVADAPDAASMFQPDRIHPSARAHPIILGNIWAVLEPWLLARPSRH